MSSRQASLALGRNPDYIDRIERDASGLGVFEFIEIAKALGQNPIDMLGEFERTCATEEEGVKEEALDLSGRRQGVCGAGN